MKIKLTTIVPEMCECERLYKDRRDKDGKMMCSACYTGSSIEDLKKLWEPPASSLNIKLPLLPEHSDENND